MRHWRANSIPYHKERRDDLEINKLLWWNKIYTILVWFASQNVYVTD